MSLQPDAIYLAQSRKAAKNIIVKFRAIPIAIGTTMQRRNNKGG
jgi:hypothetical protein